MSDKIQKNPESGLVRGGLLWLIGVPLPIIFLLWLFGFNM